MASLFIPSGIFPTSAARRNNHTMPALGCGMNLLIAAVVLATLSSAAIAENRNGFDLSNATIPKSEILDGGPPRDGIPSIDAPKFIRPDAATFMRDDDIVLSLTRGEKTRAYPLRVLVWHEIVNDTLGGEALTIAFHHAERRPEVRDARGEPLPAVMVFWFAWQAFYPTTEIWKP
jgi:hypothetical protein